MSFLRATTAAASHHPPPPASARAHAPPPATARGHAPPPARSHVAARAPRPHSAPLPQHSRAYSTETPRRWSQDIKIYDHAVKGIQEGGTKTMNNVCGNFVKQWKQEADKSKLYNMLPGRKIEGKSIGNRLEFIEFLTTKVFSSFAEHMSPRWQNIFKHQLKDLPFKDAYDLYSRLCDLSKEFLVMEDERINLERILNEVEESGRTLTDTEFSQYLRSIEIQRLQEGLNAKMNAIASDCVLLTSIAHAKKMAEKTPAKREKAQQKLEQASGFTAQQMQGLTNLQSEYARKTEELGQIDQHLFPEEYATKEEECKQCMQALLNVVKLNPAQMAQVAFKFEKKYRSKAGQKLDPEHYVYTELKYLNELQTQCMSYLLLILFSTLIGWLLLDKLNMHRKEVENEFKSFIDKATFKLHESTFDLSQMKHKLSLSIEESKYDQDFKPRIEELEELNQKLKTAIEDYDKAAKEHLEMTNLVKNIHRLKNYSNIKEFLKHSNKNLIEKGKAVATLSENISTKHAELNQAYRRTHYQTKITSALERCDMDLSELEQSKKALPAAKQQKINFFKKQVNRFRELEPGKITKEVVKKIETFANHLHLWKKAQFHKAKGP